MRVIFVADLHYALKQFDWLVQNAASFDAVIIGGDLLDLGSDLHLEIQIVVIEKYLSKLRQKTLLMISSGNHDGDSRNEADESVAQWIRDAKAEGLFVDGDSLEFAGALVTLCPWWDGPITRAQLEAQLSRAQQSVHGKWIWIHHAPPAGARVCWAGHQFAGDEFLRQWIQRFGPDMVFSGHIHNAPFYAEGSWVDQLDKTWVFNPGKQIGPSPTHIIIDFDRMTADWLSIEGQSTRQLAGLKS
jgi:Icc-related predicted phosphoesterase